ncbi:hypothetical protein ACRE_005070 [Hapsidospora chrysogenum ATCC 11550]|uniref:Uncharacterized protein n=1 Tax=Hapsidospora chrysogenum (strain ATCC 11550 / CBS 779.69 / DSM 880 / IAM 14645 / JCM 23072 / IMI 49137) TaxID=857340 RepID=A0A086TH83_HAPC1|nr:hypothetical protein ACRE_005070 [Hapsidospora chrysogenum ATCC 11550]
MYLAASQYHAEFRLKPKDETETPSATTWRYLTRLGQALTRFISTPPSSSEPVYSRPPIERGLKRLRSQTRDDDDAGEAAVNDSNPDEIHVDDLSCKQPRR